MPPRDDFFAPSPPGFERVLLAEARDLRLPQPEAQVGGVRFRGSMADAWTANLKLRSASRVLITLARFAAADADALYRGIRKIDWERFLGPEGTLKVVAHTKASALSNDHFVAQRAKDAVADAFRERHGVRPSVDLASPDLAIHVRISSDRATVSADTSGEPLFKRGWRRFSGKASLKENLAAAIVLASGWDRRAPLLDPFCGSGTLLVEGALLAAGIAPGLFREDFAFRRWPGHDEDGWRAVRETARGEIRLPPKLRILGRDGDPGAIAGARENAEAAGVGSLVTLTSGGFEGIETKPGWNAWIVTNPPYGERVGSARALVPVYRRFGEMLRQRCGGYRAAVLLGNAALGAKLGFPEAPGLVTRNGPIECELTLVDVPRN